MVDLYGRLSRLDESLRFIQSMSCAPIAEAWGALLNPNRIYKNVEMAKLASRKMEESEANNEGEKKKLTYNRRSASLPETVKLLMALSIAEIADDCNRRDIKQYSGEGSRHVPFQRPEPDISEAQTSQPKEIWFGLAQNLLL
ncbi:unnamed protein product [Lactuca saligna]|uniref:Uncharacterized protein n=1 Tax=Lactuca saligna TaxID=75948 RepID=A0AA35ZME6_LACSI|nr:unnamed protein product [Lactuca saligna]